MGTSIDLPLIANNSPSHLSGIRMTVYLTKLRLGFRFKFLPGMPITK